MTTTSSTTPHDAPRRARRIAAALPTFRTPVRGHAYAPRLPDAPPPRSGLPARLVPEPANPADPHAVAVWVDDGREPWRIGYLDRGVAARVAPRLREGLLVEAEIDGWVPEPQGRWERPVVLLRPEASATERAAGRDAAARRTRQAPARQRDEAPRIWGRPPGVARRTLGPVGGEQRGR